MAFVAVNEVLRRKSPAMSKSTRPITTTARRIDTGESFESRMARAGQPADFTSANIGRTITERSREFKANLAEQQRREGVIFEEAARERAFEDKQATRRFLRTKSFVDPIIAQLQDDTGGFDDDDIDFGGLEEVEASIRRAGDKAQGQTASVLAKRNIFRSGPSAAAAALLQAETEASVAGARGEFFERGSERRDRRRASREQALTQIATQLASGAFL